MRRVKNNRGFTFIELVIAMAVMAILGAAVAGMINTGLSSYTKISDDMENETEARAAMSLITVQLRQNDETGLIMIDNIHQVLRIRDSYGSAGCAVIWFENGWLYYDEVSAVGSSPSGIDPGAQRIARISGFTISDNESTRAVQSDPVVYVVDVSYAANGVTRHLSQSVTQRSVGDAPTT